ncbi:MAG: hydroxyacylglutathione hydrolase family protein [Deltaproteobacteria bacterium]|jgi:glyoxylase-like metal-dependent hydrolase (beta-lactamase superfamily II)|nr:hydroxyacylglutathione hydrolase family protein [Deltaproteobacteria bacterium]MCW8893900.1 hydroxyacylglutathione hydrolase family protein [Deltaproteobacteria bacterium]MCW9049500.1 hydroxyacylglutathione hydrolase family protein [Deltaproteobacteria bacterium]
MADLKIIQFPASRMDNFSYLLYCPETLTGAAIDPSMRPELLLNKAAELGVTISLLLNTHGHQDHVAGNPLILEQATAKLAAHPDELNNPDIPLTEGSRLDVGHGEITVLHTPGHTPGSLVFKTGSNIITGDTLFVSRCGRADLPGSDVALLYSSLQRLKALPYQTKVFPGHDYGPTPTSTIGWELENNAFVKCPDLESFIQLRMS